MVPIGMMLDCKNSRVGWTKAKADELTSPEPLAGLECRTVTQPVSVPGTAGSPMGVAEITHHLVHAATVHTAGQAADLSPCRRVLSLLDRQHELQLCASRPRSSASATSRVGARSERFSTETSPASPRKPIARLPWRRRRHGAALTSPVVSTVTATTHFSG